MEDAARDLGTLSHEKSKPDGILAPDDTGKTDRIVSLHSRTSWVNIKPALPCAETPTNSTYTTPHTPAFLNDSNASENDLRSRASSDATTIPCAGQKSSIQLDLSLDPKLAYPSLSLSGRVISATFTIPFVVGFSPDAEWNLQPRQGSSALYASFAYLSSASSPWDHILIGWTGEICNNSKKSPKASKALDGTQIKLEDKRRLESQLGRLTTGKIVPVWLADEAYIEPYIIKDQSRWRKFAEKDLYSLLHYKTNEVSNNAILLRKAWQDYYRMNLLFADRILEIYEPGDVVSIQNYNLMLLPALIRQRLPQAYISFFLHTPFPSIEYFRCTTRRRELLGGLIGANLIGFQSPHYTRHFSTCCNQIMDFDFSITGVDAHGAHVAIDALPIGIDAVAIEQYTFGEPAIANRLKSIRQLYPDTQIVLGRDRLDTVRGATQKLQAFEVFLKRYPEWHGKVVLVQVSSPGDITTDGRNGESKYLDKISELASKINGKYGSLSFTPVQHFPQDLQKEEYYALLRAAHVGLITSVRDAMNTTALEFIICQQTNHSPLILSEFSGTFSSLGDGALHVNPWDLSGVADTINGALCMSPSEKESRHRKLYEHVTTHNVQNWASSCIKRLLNHLEAMDQPCATPLLDQKTLLDRYKEAKKRLFLFDYDGTLTPIVQDPASAIPTEHVMQALTTLAEDPKNSVWIISGRDQVFLDEYLGSITALGLSAEHGCFMRGAQQTEWVNIAEHADMSWQEQVSEIFGRYTRKTPGSNLERKKVALTWHYRRAQDPIFGAKMAQEAQRELEATISNSYDVEIMTGKMNLEVRPRFVDKGFIAKRLIEEYEANSLEFVLCFGDDSTDEDMFRSLKQSSLPPSAIFPVSVGAPSKQTVADWHLLEPADVIDVIEKLGALEFVGSVAPDLTDPVCISERNKAA